MSKLFIMSNECVDDEPDYMSDDFLAKCIPEDVRPGFKRVSSFVFEFNIHSMDHDFNYMNTDLVPRILIKIPKCILDSQKST